MSLDNKTMIPIVNKRSSSFSISLPNGQYFEWMPSSMGVEDIIEMEFRDVQYVHMRSSTFREGYLFINNEEARKRLGLEKEEVKMYSISRDEIETILKGNMNSLKKLDKLKDNNGVMREIVEVAKDIGLDNINKLNYISELSGVPVEVITGDIEK